MSKHYKISLLAIIMMFFLCAVPSYANDKDKDKNKSDKNTTSNAKGKLETNQDPTMVGKRDINKRQINFYSVEKEIAIGQGLAGEAERQLKFIDDPIVTEYINRIGQNIALNSDAKVPFTIKVVDSEEINAFALPGGFFFVNKGLILAADNESEIVGVMAHEIAHVAARHGTEQVSKGQFVNYASIGLIFLGGPIGLAARSAANLAIPLTFLKFSRGAENEADVLGAQYAWASGYDPMGMVSVFEKLSKKEKKVSSVFSDHPATGDRAVTVRNLISKFPEKDEYLVNSSDFVKVKSRLLALSGRPAGGGDPLANADGRPTLKRRQGDNSSGDINSDSQPSDNSQGRPTLKRRTDGPDAQPTSDTQQQPQGRPTLKRNGGSGNSSSDSDSSSSSSSNDDDND
ncbi:MAG: M48 family metalloprotease [Acidobacteria bacterium]|nr:M48 family metalloprotease [Acidobacteriota bacterium]